MQDLFLSGGKLVFVYNPFPGAPRIFSKKNRLHGEQVVLSRRRVMVLARGATIYLSVELIDLSAFTIYLSVSKGSD